MTSKLKESYANLEERVRERTAELVHSNKQLKRFNKLAVGRELRMVELNREINALLRELEREEKYRSPSDIAENLTRREHSEG